MKTFRIPTLLFLMTMLLAVMTPTARAAFSITSQPADATAYTNTTAKLQVSTQGSGNPNSPDTVDWYFNASSAVGLVAPGNLLTIAPPYSSTISSDSAQGQTYWTNLLAISPTMPGNAGFYACVLSKGSTVITSAVAQVTIVGGTFEVVSVQLADPPNTGGFQALAPTDLTGAFEAGNWNPVEVSTPSGIPDDEHGISWVEQTFDLKDRDGIGSGVQLIVRGASDAWRHDDPQTSSAPITKLMNTFIKTWYRPDGATDPNGFGTNFLGEGKMELELTNLDNAETYNVYVYLADNDKFAAGVDAGSGVTNHTGSLPDSVPNAFVESVNQNPIGFRDPGNYVSLTGITPVGGSIVVSVNYFDPDWLGFGAGVCGLQLVNASIDQLPAMVTKDPADQSVYTDVAATFSLELEGKPTPSIQWYQVTGGVTNSIPGAVSLSYTTPPATLGMNGMDYFAVVSNGAGSDTSAAATLTVLTPPADARDVLSVQLANVGATWFQPLGVAESMGAFPTTNWNPVQVAVSGIGPGFWAEQHFPLKNQYGVGNGIDLIVRGAADFVTLSAPPSDAAPITKLLNTSIKGSWRQDEFGPNLLGEGTMELILTNLDNAVTYNAYVYLMDDWERGADVTAGAGVTNYIGDLRASVSGDSGLVTSINTDPAAPRDSGNYVHLTGITPVDGAATITVNYYDPPWQGFGVGVSGLQLVKASLDLVAPAITENPQHQRVLTNTTATLSVGAALGSPQGSLQWHQVIGGISSPIAGATNSTYTTAPVTDGTSGRGYYAVASSGLGSDTSATAFVTAAHLVSPAPGFLQVDQYSGPDANVLPLILDPSWQAANSPPSNTLWITTFEHQSALWDQSGERIYGWFTPPVTTNYVFFISADDETLFLMSTDSSPANRCQIALEEFWSADGSYWTNSGGGSSLSQKRSDQFVYDSFLPGASWPTGNTISLVAGNQYYVEVGHIQGGGGQSAAVTYKFEGEPDPADGTPTVITSDQLSTAGAPDYLLPSPVPQILNVSVSGGNVALDGGNGIVNGLYYVLSSPDLSMPLESWTVVETNFFDLSGDFSSSVPQNPLQPVSFYQLLSVQ
jgi:hypothetical protein